MERPIIFSGENIKKILSGAKTQSRRIIKPNKRQAWLNADTLNAVLRFAPSKDNWWTMAVGEYKQINHCGHLMDGGHIGSIRCPYGKVGDTLWCRESFLADPPDDGSWCYYEYSDGVLHNYSRIPERFQNPEHVLYKATYKHQHLCWKSPIHMPRWAARITLKIENIRVERIRDISDDDAQAEGCSKYSDSPAR